MCSNDRDFEYEMAKQRRFVERSAMAFDKGDRDEAVRIAANLRIIFHGGSGNTRSLITHLRIRQTIQVLSSCGGEADEPGARGRPPARAFEFKLGFVRTQAGRGWHEPWDFNPRSRVMVPVDFWWQTQVVWRLDPRRHSLVEASF